MTLPHRSPTCASVRDSQRCCRFKTRKARSHGRKLLKCCYNSSQLGFANRLWRIDAELSLAASKLPEALSTAQVNASVGLTMFDSIGSFLSADQTAKPCSGIRSAQIVDQTLHLEAGELGVHLPVKTRLLLPDPSLTGWRVLSHLWVARALLLRSSGLYQSAGLQRHGTMLRRC